MKKATIKALGGSIAHWERLATGQREYGESIGKYHCPLCQRFDYADCTRPDGEMCPVMARTGEAYCNGSPYMGARIASVATGGYNLDTAEFKAAAQEEMEFLRSLLPEEETDQ